MEFRCYLGRTEKLFMEQVINNLGSREQRGYFWSGSTDPPNSASSIMVYQQIYWNVQGGLIFRTPVCITICLSVCLSVTWPKFRLDRKSLDQTWPKFRLDRKSLYCHVPARWGLRQTWACFQHQFTFTYTSTLPMGFLPDSHPHKLMINYSMIKSWIDFTQLHFSQQTDGQTNPNYSMIRPVFTKTGWTWHVTIFWQRQFSQWANTPQFHDFAKSGFCSGLNPGKHTQYIETLYFYKIFAASFNHPGQTKTTWKTHPILKLCIFTKSLQHP